MSEQLEDLFSQYYRGRHDPADAFWWLNHPELTSPTGAPPVQQLFLEVADDLEQTHFLEAATALREALADLLQSDRQAALDALRRSRAQLANLADEPSTD